MADVNHADSGRPHPPDHRRTGVRHRVWSTNWWARRRPRSAARRTSTPGRSPPTAGPRPKGHGPALSGRGSGWPSSSSTSRTRPRWPRRSTSPHCDCSCPNMTLSSTDKVGAQRQFLIDHRHARRTSRRRTRSARHVARDPQFARVRRDGAAEHLHQRALALRRFRRSAANTSPAFSSRLTSTNAAVGPNRLATRRISSSGPDEAPDGDPAGCGCPAPTCATRLRSGRCRGHGAALGKMAETLRLRGGAAFSSSAMRLPASCPPTRLSVAT
jgi:hypothetical protein